MKLIVGVIGLLIATQYLVRTEWVIGGLVAERLTKIAKSRGIEIEVAGLRPDGLTGVALTNVSVFVPRASTSVEAHFERIVVRPNVSDLFERKLTIQNVLLENGEVAIVDGQTRPQKRRTTPSKKTPTSAAKPSAPRKMQPVALKSVSYTHLTLPTILLV